MKVLITGARGFIGKNLELNLVERGDISVLCFGSSDELSLLPSILLQADIVFHLAGVNRPQSNDDFVSGNIQLTQAICDGVKENYLNFGKKQKIIYTSSTQANNDTPYGSSKREAEKILVNLATTCSVPVYVFRLPNVFGKWSKPNYNSAVATFCYNVARNIPIDINNPNSPLTLVYIDDVVECFMNLVDGIEPQRDEFGFSTVQPEYKTTVGDVAAQIQSFGEIRKTSTIGGVGTGLTRGLYATYVSYLPASLFSYPLNQHRDHRGIFVEMLKTTDSGQFSFFTAPPGVTRGGHYHHSKTEKFLVVKGSACFRFKHMLTGEYHELTTDDENPEIVETVPGWTHDITNVGNGEMIVMLWANEIFCKARPDTFARPL